MIMLCSHKLSSIGIYACFYVFHNEHGKVEEDYNMKNSFALSKTEIKRRYLPFIHTLKSLKSVNFLKHTRVPPKINPKNISVVTDCHSSRPTPRLFFL